MTTAPNPLATGVDVRHAVRSHWFWLAFGLLVAFLVPLVLADVLGVQRDVYYGLYMLAVVALVGGWLRATGLDPAAFLTRKWAWGAALGVAFAGVMAIVAVRAEDATARPDGFELVLALLWRGIAYGLADGMLLSAFPILAVFAALAAWRRGVVRTAVVGAAALVASLAFTAVYHAGYADFRGEKLAKPVAGDALWSVPTLVTLSPLGAPLAHAGLHVSAVLHAYETDLFLPPHD